MQYVRADNLRNLLFGVHTQSAVQEIGSIVPCHNVRPIQHILDKRNVELHNKRCVVENAEREYDVVSFYQYPASELYRKVGERKPIGLRLDFKFRVPINELVEIPPTNRLYAGMLEPFMAHTDITVFVWMQLGGTAVFHSPVPVADKRNVAAARVYHNIGDGMDKHIRSSENRHPILLNACYAQPVSDSIAKDFTNSHINMRPILEHARRTHKVVPVRKKSHILVPSVEFATVPVEIAQHLPAVGDRKRLGI